MTGCPFEVRAPNAETREAIEELEAGRRRAVRRPCHRVCLTDLRGNRRKRRGMKSLRHRGRLSQRLQARVAPVLPALPPVGPKVEIADAQFGAGPPLPQGASVSPIRSDMSPPTRAALGLPVGRPSGGARHHPTPPCMSCATLASEANCGAAHLVEICFACSLASRIAFESPWAPLVTSPIWRSVSMTA